jgi:hypothetical protein
MRKTHNAHYSVLLNTFEYWGIVLAHSHGFDKYSNTQLMALLDYLEKHDMGLGYGMVNLWILVQLLRWVLVRVPLDSQEVPFPSSMDIRSPDVLLCRIRYTRLAVIMVWVSSILESSL